MSDFYRIDKKSGECTKIPETPEGKFCYQGNVKFRNSIYLFGGYKSRGGNTKECYRLDVDSLSWNRISDLPAVSCYCSAVKIRNEILVTSQDL